jgi:hypothetical protein
MQKMAKADQSISPDISSDPEAGFSRSPTGCCGILEPGKVGTYMSYFLLVCGKLVLFLSFQCFIFDFNFFSQV